VVEIVGAGNHRHSRGTEKESREKPFSLSMNVSTSRAERKKNIIDPSVPKIEGIYSVKYFRFLITHNSSKYLERNLAKEKFGGFFPSNYAILSFRKCLNY